MSKIISLIKKQKKESKFLNNVLTLMIGTSLAQAISIAISPILTRLFTPNDFGVLALYGALVSTISVIITMRYEMAIVQPQDEEDAYALLWLSIGISITISFMLFLIILVFNEDIVVWLSAPSLSYWLYLLPLSVLLTGIYQGFNYLNIRQEKYKNISTAQISQSLSSATGQLTMGWWAISGALIWGQLLGLCMSVVVLIKRTLPENIVKVMSTSIDKIVYNAKVYKKFPLFSTAGALANSLSAQMPILILTKYFDSAVTGLFSLTYRVLTLPMTLMAQALSQVVYQRISVAQHKNPELIKPQVVKLMIILFLMMVPFVILVWLFGESMFVLIFGEAWREAGQMAGLLVIAVAARFPVSALSTVLALNKTIKLGVLWQIVYFFTISVTLFYFSNKPLEMFLYAFVVHEVFLSFIYAAFIVKVKLDVR